MENREWSILEETELEYSIAKALRYEFETAEKERAIQIYRTSYQMSYYDQAKEMASDIEIDFNIKLV